MKYYFEESGPKRQDYKNRFRSHLFSIRVESQILEIWYLVVFLYKLRMLSALKWPIWLILVYVYDTSIFWHIVAIF